MSYQPSAELWVTPITDCRGERSEPKVIGIGGITAPLG